MNIIEMVSSIDADLDKLFIELDEAEEDANAQKDVITEQLNLMEDELDFLLCRQSDLCDREPEDTESDLYFRWEEAMELLETAIDEIEDEIFRLEQELACA